MGAAKHWYARIVGGVQGGCKELQTKLCLSFFHVSHVTLLRIEVHAYQQKEMESIGASWARFNDPYTSGPNLAIRDELLLQHFYLVLSRDTTQFLGIASRDLFCMFLLAKGEKS